KLLGGGARLLPRAFEIREVEERQREVDPGYRQGGIRAERAAKRADGVGVIVLLEQAQPHVVLPVGLLPKGDAVRHPARQAEAEQRAEGDEASSHWEIGASMSARKP